MAREKKSTADPRQCKNGSKYESKKVGGVMYNIYNTYLDHPPDDVNALMIYEGEKFYKVQGTIIDYDLSLGRKIKQHMVHGVIFASKIKNNKVKWVLVIAFLFKVGKLFKSKGWEPKHKVDKMLSEIESHPNVKPWKEMDVQGSFRFPYERR